ncbi:MAG: LTA synthase family protein, partial [Lachnospiraceae bacterium]|nr:LTA synthase family protein [Lachnospiraceae bacterium]
MEMALVSYTQYNAVKKAQWPGYAIANMLTIFAFMLLMQALLSNWTVSLVLTSLLLELYALTTYYVIQFHGTVMTIEDVKNIETVNNVIGSYHLEPSPTVYGIVLRFAATVLIIAAAAVLVWKKKLIGKDRKGRIGRAAAAVMILLFLYSPSGNIANAADDVWDWGNLYCRVGLTAGTIESTIANFGEIVDKPDNYSDRAAGQVMEGRTESAADKPAGADPSAADYPDIIMILNESWYDMDTFRDDLEPDGTWMDNFNDMENAVKGRAIVPFVGGGINATEYEFLTANSMQLINAYAPFNRINMTGSHTVVDYLEDLGYSTMAAHCHNAANYHRSISWEQMGFDAMYFIGDFTDLAFYGHRTNDHRATDISAFDNFIRFYEDMPEDGPRFGYLLTMQNHGGWNTNPEEEDLIRVTGGDLPEFAASRTNEFISCVSLTDEMIPVMEDYFTGLYETEGRRVVVCMVGDHAPSFINELSDNRYDMLEENVRMRSTPFFIWRNYTDEDNTAPYDGELIDACSLLPGVVSYAGLPLSGYFSYILDMQQQVTAFTNITYSDDGEGEQISGFLDADGAFRSFDEGSELADMVSGYYILEYNNNGESANRYEEVFAP